MATCKRCRATISWIKTTKGFRPINEDGTEHFNTCPVQFKPIDKVMERTIQSERKKFFDNRIQIGENEYI